jgi:hypothetical protein
LNELFFAQAKAIFQSVSFQPQASGKVVEEKPNRLNALFSPFQSIRALCLLIFLLTVIIALFYRPFNQIVGGDSAIYDYISQAILRGQLPYRDIADIKFPGSVYLNAVAMWGGELVGIRDIYALRLLQIVELGLLSVFTFLVVEVYLENRIAALIAVLLPLLNDHYIGWAIIGTQPKLPMMMFGMLTLLLIAKDKLFWAGLCSMLACLCWQPGLLFTGTAGLVCSGYLLRWRDLRVIKVIAGAAIPLALLFGYFYAKGAFGDFWAWTMQYNYSVFGPDANRGIGGGLNHLWRVMSRIFGADVVLVILSVFGFLLFIAERVWMRLKKREATYTAGQFKDALIFPPLVYLIFSIINLQGGPDLIPFFPFISLFAGWFLVSLISFAASKLKALTEPRQQWVYALLLITLFSLVAFRAVRYRIEGETLQDQFRKIQPLAEALSPDDTIYVHGTVELLVLLKRPNLNPYIFLDWGADEFAGSRKAGGFPAIIDEMEAAKPKIVSLTRLKKIKYRTALEDWVAAHYEPFGDPDNSIYIRR